MPHHSSTHVLTLLKLLNTPSLEGGFNNFNNFNFNVLRKVAGNSIIMSNRHPDKVMLDSWGAFDTAIKLSNKVIEEGKVNMFKYLSKLVTVNYFEFNKDWRNYKADIIKEIAKTEDRYTVKYSKMKAAIYTLVRVTFCHMKG